jgi:regulator of replication initiation timing
MSENKAPIKMNREELQIAIEKICLENPKAIKYSIQLKLAILFEQQTSELQTEIDRLKAALDFNVKENINILRQFSESIEENKRLKAENEKLKFMAENGLGYKDMENDMDFTTLDFGKRNPFKNKPKDL